MLRVYDQPDLDSFPPGLWDIREPTHEKDGKPRPNGKDSPTHPTCAPRPDTPTPALDADQQLDLILVPGECFARVERTSRGNEDCSSPSQASPLTLRWAG